MPGRHIEHEQRDPVPAQAHRCGAFVVSFRLHLATPIARTPLKISPAPSRRAAPLRNWVSVR